MSDMVPTYISKTMENDGSTSKTASFGNAGMFRSWLDVLMLPWALLYLRGVSSSLSLSTKTTLIQTQPGNFSSLNKW